MEKWVDKETGASTGRLGQPDSLLRAVDSLINSKHVNAVAVVARFPDDSVDELQDYRQGQVCLFAGHQCRAYHAESDVAI